jgi:predicted nucleic acid-binding protein/GNAT superfamily N-acetyltransferase
MARRAKQTTLEIVEVPADGEEFSDVLALAAANRRYLGFLPDAGFTDRTRKGTLLAASGESGILGYVLYDLPGERVKIVHLCVAPHARKLGVARALIAEVSARHTDRRGLELACRRDFPADKIWPALGFRPVAERRGRSRSGKYLTIWLLPHEHDDLFSLRDEHRELAAVDTNIFKDLTSSRPQGAQTRHLLEDWISELVEICATDELLHEINRCAEDKLRQQMQSQASSYRMLQAREKDWKSLLEPVAAAAPKAGEADHRHIARAVAGGATYFLTRDEDILVGAERLRESLRVLVVRPESLILRLDQMRSTGAYEPEALAATSIESIATGAIDERQFTMAFLNHAAGERATGLHHVLRDALATPKASDVRVYRTHDGELLGTLITVAVDGELRVRLIRVARSDRLGRAVARQLAFLPRQIAAERNIRRVVIEDHAPSLTVVGALEDELFRQTGDGRWSSESLRGIHGIDELTAGRDGEGSPAAQHIAANAERRLWPAKFTGTALPTFMIAIHPTWAAQLFDTNLVGATLFPRNLSLGLSREHVYYRGPGWAGGLRSPARILWYVKGGTPANQVGYLSAVSQLAEVVVGAPRPLHRRFARLGVWDEQEVCKASATNNTVMALRFRDTELFANPVALPTLRALYGEQGLTFKAPQSPTPVPEHMFCLLYRRASAYGS